MGGSPPHPHDMAAANRTLSCGKTQNFISTHELTQASHFGPDFLPSLRRRCPSQVATVSVRQVSPYQVSQTKLKPLMAIHPSQCSLKSIVEKEFQLGCNLAPAFCTTHSTKVQVSVHGLVIQMFCSQVSTVVISTNSLILMSPLITRRCNHSVGVAICLIRPAPVRTAMARPAVASSLISKLGLSTPSPDPFA